MRLRGILGKKTGHEEDISSSFAHDFEFKKPTIKRNYMNLMIDAKKEFLNGAKIAYETIITSLLKEK